MSPGIPKSQCSVPPEITCGTPLPVRMMEIDEREKALLSLYSAWMEHVLEENGVEFEFNEESFIVDVSNGVCLVYFFACLAKTYSTNLTAAIKVQPQFRIQKIANISKAFEIVEREGLALTSSSTLGTSINPEDIADGVDVSMIVNMFAVVFDFFVKSGFQFEGEKGLLACERWITSATAPFPAFEWTGFESGVRNGLAICYCLMTYNADLIDTALLNGSESAVLDYGLNVLRSKLNFPIRLGAGDFALHPPPLELNELMMCMLYYLLAHSGSAPIEIRHVGTMMQYSIRNEFLREEYNTLSRQILSWISSKMKELSEDLVISPKGVESAQRTFLLSVQEQRPALEVLLESWKTLDYKLYLRLKAKRRPKFVPAASLSPEAILAQNTLLVETEIEREQTLEKGKGSVILLDFFKERYDLLASEFSAWAEDVFDFLKDSDYGSNYIEVQEIYSKLLNLKVEFGVQGGKVEELRLVYDKFAVLLEGSLPPDQSTVEEFLDLKTAPATIADMWTALLEALKEKSENVNAFLEDEMDIEVLRHEYAMKSDAFVARISHSYAPFRQKKVDQADLIKCISLFHEDEAQSQQDLAQLREMCLQITDVHPLALQQDEQMDISALEDLYNSLRVLVVSKETELTAKIPGSELNMQFRELARMLSQWLLQVTKTFAQVPQIFTSDDLATVESICVNYESEARERVPAMQKMEEITNYVRKERIDEPMALGFTGLKSRWQVTERVFKAVSNQLEESRQNLKQSTTSLETLSALGKRVSESFVELSQSLQDASQKFEDNDLTESVLVARNLLTNLYNMDESMIDFLRLAGSLVQTEIRIPGSDTILNNAARLYSDWQVLWESTSQLIEEAEEEMGRQRSVRALEVRYELLSEELTSYLSTMTETMSKICSLDVLFEASQTLSFHSAILEELRGLDDSLRSLGSESHVANFEVIVATWEDISAQMDARVSDLVIADLSGTNAQNYAALAQTLHEMLLSSRTACESIQVEEWETLKAHSLKVSAINAHIKSIGNMRSLLRQLSGFYDELRAEEVTVAADEHLLPIGLSRRVDDFEHDVMELKDKSDKVADLLEKTQALRMNYQDQAALFLKNVQAQVQQLVEPAECLHSSAVDVALALHADRMPVQKELQLSCEGLLEMARVVQDVGDSYPISFSVPVTALQQALTGVQDLSRRRYELLLRSKDEFALADGAEAELQSAVVAVESWLQRVEQVISASKVMDTLEEVYAVQGEVAACREERMYWESSMMDVVSLGRVLQNCIGRNKPAINATLEELNANWSRVLSNFIENEQDLSQNVARVETRDELNRTVKTVEETVASLQSTIDSVLLLPPNDLHLLRGSEHAMMAGLERIKSLQQSCRMAVLTLSTAYSAYTNARVSSSHPLANVDEYEEETKRLQSQLAEIETKLSLLFVGLEEGMTRLHSFRSLQQTYQDNSRELRAFLESEGSPESLHVGLLDSVEAVAAAEDRLMVLEEKRVNGQALLLTCRQVAEDIRAIYQKENMQVGASSDVLAPAPALALLEIGWQAFIERLPLLKTSTQNATRSFQSMEEQKRLLAAKIDQLAEWLEGVSEQISQLPLDSLDVHVVHEALRAMRKVSESTVEKGRLLAEILRKDAECLLQVVVNGREKTGPLQQGNNFTAISVKGLETKWLTFQRQLHSAVASLQIQLTKAQTEDEMKAQLQERAAALLEWLSMAHPAVEELPVGGTLGNVRSQRLRLTFWQKQKAEEARKYAEMQSLLEVYRQNLPGGEEFPKMVIEIEERWQSLTRHIEEKERELNSASEALNVLHDLQHEFATTRDTLAQWMVDMRKMLLQEVSEANLESAAAMLLEFENQKTNKGLPLLDGLRGIFEQLTARGEKDRGEYLVMEVQWDTLINTASHLEASLHHLVSVRDFGLNLVKEINEKAEKLMQWSSGCFMTLESLNLTNSLPALQANLSRLMSVYDEITTAVVPFREILTAELVAKEKLSSSLTELKYSSNDLIRRWHGLYEAVCLSYDTHLECMNGFLTLEVHVDDYRNTMRKILSWTMSQQLNLESLSWGLCTEKLFIQQSVLKRFMKEHDAKQGAFTGLESSWEHLQSANYQDLNALPTPGELREKWNAVEWTAKERSSRLEAGLEKFKEVEGLRNSYFEQASQVHHWMFQSLATMCSLPAADRRLEETTLDSRQVDLEEIQQFLLEGQAMMDVLSSQYKRMLELLDGEHDASVKIVGSEMVHLGTSWTSIEHLVTVGEEVRLRDVQERHDRLHFHATYADLSGALHAYLSRLEGLLLEEEEGDQTKEQAPSMVEDHLLRPAATDFFIQHETFVSLQHYHIRLQQLQAVKMDRGFLAFEALQTRWQRMAQRLSLLMTASWDAEAARHYYATKREGLRGSAEGLLAWIAKALTEIQATLANDPSRSSHVYEEACICLSRLQTETTSRQNAVDELLRFEEEEKEGAWKGGAREDAELSLPALAQQLRGQWQALQNALQRLRGALEEATRQRLAHRAAWGRYVGLHAAIAEWMAQVRSGDGFGSLQSLAPSSSQSSQTTQSHSNATFVAQQPEFATVRQAQRTWATLLPVLESMQAEFEAVIVEEGLELEVLKSNWKGLEAELSVIQQQLEENMGKRELLKADGQKLMESGRSSFEGFVEWLQQLWQLRVVESEESILALTALNERGQQCHGYLQLLLQRLSRMELALEQDSLSISLYVSPNYSKPLLEIMSQVLVKTGDLWRERLPGLRARVQKHANGEAKFIAAARTFSGNLANFGTVIVEAKGVMHSELEKVGVEAQMLLELLGESSELRNRAFSFEDSFVKLCELEEPLLGQVGAPSSIVSRGSLASFILYEEWYDCADQTREIVETIKARYDYLHRLQSSMTLDTVSRFVDEAMKYIKAFSIPSELVDIQTTMVSLRLFMMKKEEFSHKLEVIAQETKELGMFHEIEGLMSRWEVMMRENEEKLPPLEILEERMRVVARTRMTMIEFAAVAEKIRSWVVYAFGYLQMLEDPTDYSDGIFKTRLLTDFFAPSLQEMEHSMEECSRIWDQLQDMDALATAQNPFTAESASSLRVVLQHTEQLLSGKLESVEEEMRENFEQSWVILHKYVKAAHDLLGWINNSMMVLSYGLKDKQDKQAENDSEVTEDFDGAEVDVLPVLLAECRKIQLKMDEQRENLRRLTDYAQSMSEAGVRNPVRSNLAIAQVRERWNILERLCYSRLQKLEDLNLQRKRIEEIYSIDYATFITYRQLFQLFDRDSSGAINEDEFCQMMRVMGENLPRPEAIDRMRRFAQRNRDECLIELNEFIIVMQTYYKKVETPEDMITALRNATHGHSVNMNKDELLSILKPCLQKDELQLLSKLVVVRPNGTVNIADLVSKIFEM